MGWLKVVIAKAFLYNQTVEASKDERITHATDHYLGRMRNFQDSLKNVSDSDLERINHPKHIDEAIQLGHIPLTLTEQARRITPDSWSQEDGRHYVINNSGYSPNDAKSLNGITDNLLSAIKGDEGARQQAGKAVRSYLQTDTPPDHHAKIKSALDTVTQQHMPDVMQRFDDVPVFSVGRPNRVSDTTSALHRHSMLLGGLISVYHPEHRNGHIDGTPQEGDNSITRSLHDVIRHEIGHDVAHQILSREFTSGQSTHPDSLWNRVYKGAMGINSKHGYALLDGAAEPTDHEKQHNLYLRNIIHTGRDSTDGEYGEKAKPLSAYSMKNPDEWFGEMFSAVTHPEYDKIRRGCKSKSTLEGLDYVASKIGRS